MMGPGRNHPSRLRSTVSTSITCLLRCPPVLQRVTTPTCTQTQLSGIIMKNKTSFSYPSMEENPVLFNNNRRSANMASAGLSWLSTGSFLSWPLRPPCLWGWTHTREFFGIDAFFLCDLKLQKSGKDTFPRSEVIGRPLSSI